LIGGCDFQPLAVPGLPAAEVTASKPELKEAVNSMVFTAELRARRAGELV